METIVKNCGDIVHMHVAEKDLLHEMVKIVKKKVITGHMYVTSLFLLFPRVDVGDDILFATVARLPCQREDIDSHRYLARSIWRTKGKIPTVLCCIPGIIGMPTECFHD